MLDLIQHLSGDFYIRPIMFIAVCAAASILLLTIGVMHLTYKNSKDRKSRNAFLIAGLMIMMMSIIMSIFTSLDKTKSLEDRIETIRIVDFKEATYDDIEAPLIRRLVGRDKLKIATIESKNGRFKTQMIGVQTIEDDKNNYKITAVDGYEFKVSKDLFEVLVDISEKEEVSNGND